MKYWQFAWWVLISLVLVGCPLDSERPPVEVQPVELPSLPESIIQVPLVLKSTALKNAFRQEFPNPLIKGKTKTLTLQLQGKERKKSERNFIQKITDPVLGWVDKTFDASAQVDYQVDLKNYNFWFRSDSIFTDLVMDLGTTVELRNSMKLLGESLKLDGDLNCPMEIHIALSGKLQFKDNASLDVLLNDNNARFTFIKVCSSKAIEKVNLPKLLEPVLEPLRKEIIKGINKIITQQLQRVLNKNSAFLSFQDRIDKMAALIGQPHKLLDEVWLTPNVQEIFVSQPYGTGVGVNNQVAITVGVKAKPTVMVAAKEPSVTIPKTLNFAVEHYKSGTTVYVNGKVSLDYAAKQMQTFLKDYVDKNYSKYGYTIGKTVLYASGERVVVAIDVLKTKTQKRKATIYLWGVPKYDAKEQVIYLDDLAFTAKSKNVILKFAQWILHPKILKQLEANARFALSDQLQKVQHELNHFTVKEPVGTLTGTFDYLNIDKVFVSKTDFDVYLKAKGSLDFQLNL